VTSVVEHYEHHLAPIYLWLSGGMNAALARGQLEVAAACPRPAEGQMAVDLGAGFGMHAIPLAAIGYSVLAIDSSGTLLDAMRSHAGARSIRIVRDDLLSFRRHLQVPAALILCMGDTLTHLADKKSVEDLFAEVAEALADGGTFIVTFRDYTVPLIGSQRFIPVRGDSDRILTCFLEYHDGYVMVHDILNERDGPAWGQRVSAYRKLRLSPAWVANAIEATGLQVLSELGPAGMSRLIATNAT
jgi:SAM-dependent methyltransferase